MGLVNGGIDELIYGAAKAAEKVLGGVETAVGAAVDGTGKAISAAEEAVSDIKAAVSKPKVIKITDTDKKIKEFEKLKAEMNKSKEHTKEEMFRFINCGGLVIGLGYADAIKSFHSLEFHGELLKAGYVNSIAQAVYGRLKGVKKEDMYIKYYTLINDLVNRGLKKIDREICYSTGQCWDNLGIGSEDVFAATRAEMDDQELSFKYDELSCMTVSPVKLENAVALNYGNIEYSTAVDLTLDDTDMIEKNIETALHMLSVRMLVRHGMDSRSALEFMRCMHQL